MDAEHQSVVSQLGEDQRRRRLAKVYVFLIDLANKKHTAESGVSEASDSAVSKETAMIQETITAKGV
jgi:hypothetical protein